MTARYTLSPRARVDIDAIWDYSAARWGTDQAEFYLRQLRSHIEMIAVRPEAGRACPEIRAGYRKYRSGSHVLFYLQVDYGIEIIRILHEGMDFGRYL